MKQNRIISALLWIGRRTNTETLQLLFDNNQSNQPGIRNPSGTNKLQYRTEGNWNDFPADTVPEYLTGATTVDATDKNKLFLCRTLTAAIPITLPSPGTVGSGFKFQFLDAEMNGDVNNISFVRAGSEKIHAIAATFTCQDAGAIGEIFTDGTDWFFTRRFNF